MAAQAIIPFIHHEQQEKGSMLCAQHAINCLLQKSIYDAGQLSDIALQLDDLERSTLSAAEYAASRRDAQSLNMDDTGFFSVSVLESALRVWNLTLVSWKSAEMREFHSHPEEQLAFVLNLESHWFTVRGFGSRGDLWFNLNSFLDRPTYVGRFYLSEMLRAAEQEGYSVFVVREITANQGGSGQSDLKFSEADLVADTLPVELLSESVAGGSSSTSHGLHPTGEGSRDAVDLGFEALDREAAEDAELQAALQESLKDAVLAAPQDTPTRSSVGPANEASARLASTALAGNVRRARSASAEEEGDDDEVEEEDKHIDYIAPSRRRTKQAAPLPIPLSIASASSSSTQSAPPLARLAGADLSGDAEEDEQLRAALLASVSQGPRSIDSSKSAGDGRSLGVVQNSKTPGRQQASARSSRRNRMTPTVGSSRADAIDLGSDGDDDDPPSSHSPRRSPFLHPAARGADLETIDVDALDSPDEDDEFVDDVAWGGNLGSARGAGGERIYDDEDAEFQAALAASMGAEYAPGESGFSIAEAQAREWASPPPADVERISKMREEARRKARLDAERAERGGSPEGLQGKSTKVNGADDEDDEDDEDEDDANEEKVSAEEMRRRRLARFGA